MKLIKNSLNFLQACQELSTNDKLFISRKAWDSLPYQYYDELDEEYYDDEGKQYLHLDSWNQRFCSFYDEMFGRPIEKSLAIDDVLAQDWEVWDREY